MARSLALLCTTKGWLHCADCDRVCESLELLFLFPPLFLQAVLAVLVELLGSSPHMEFLLCWAKAVLIAHGPALAAAAGGATALRAAVVGGGGGGASAAAAAAGGGVGAVLRALQQAVGRLHQDLSSTAEGNVYLLNYLVEAGKLQQQQSKQQKEQGQEEEQQQEGQQQQLQEDDQHMAPAAAGKQQAVDKQRHTKQKQKLKQKLQQS